MRQFHFSLLFFIWNVPRNVDSFSLSSSIQTRNSQARIHSTPITTRTLLCATKEDEPPTPTPTQQVVEIDTLTYNQLIELTELSFLQACLALSQGHTVEPLQLFIVTVQAALQHNTSIAKVVEAVNALSTQRPLDVSEQDLRAAWIQAIGLVLSYSGKPIEDLDETIVKTYGASVLDDLVAIRQSGLGLNAHQFVQNRQEILFSNQKNVLVLEEDQDEIDSVQMAIVTQTIKVLYYTLVVLEEPPLATEEEPKTSPKSKKKKSSNTGRGFG